MKNSLKLLTVFSCLMSTFSMYGIGVFSGGAGTLANPYQIATLADLRFLSENNSYWAAGKYFIQTADIDATATNTWNVGNHDNNAGTPNVAMGFSPIGIGTSPFSGKYDGQGHTISNLYINRLASDYIGLFGVVDTNLGISNLGLTNINMTGRVCVGGLIGYAGSGTFSNVYTTGTLVSNPGGNSSAFLGGLIGFTGVNCTTSSSYSGANVTTSETGLKDGAGGLIGRNDGTITGCYATGNIGGDGSFRGGLVGDNNNSISQSYATGNVNGSTTAGDYFGGLVGRNREANISNCYASGRVTGYASVGGLIGYFLVTSGTYSVTNSYATGAVLCTHILKGGFIGSNSNAVVTNCFWDTQTTGISTSNGGVGKSTAEMKIQATFTNWDFSTTPVWKINSNNNGYPNLVWQYYPIFSGGAGTLASPYQIATLADLRFLSENNSYWATGKYFIQTADIDATATNTWNSNGTSGYFGFSPVGNLATNFLGNYNGQGFKITNLYINRPSTDYNGVFGYVSNATITNLGITNVNITGNKQTGGMIGQTSGLCTVTNCFTTGSITGIADQAGGLIGKKDCSGTVSNCYSSCNISCQDNGGGLIAAYRGGVIEKSFATGNVNVANNIAGGLVGEIYNVVESVTITINNCYAKGNVSSLTSTTGLNNTGGFVGHAYAGTITINKCYSTGIVTGNFANLTKGFIGNHYKGTVNNCFFDAENDGLTNSTAGTNYNGAIGKTTAEMKNQATFTGWDFVTAPDWKITSNKNNGNPYLAWQNLPIDVPAVQASALVFSAVHNYDMTIGWTNGTGEARAVFVKEGTGAITNPVNQTTYTASSDWATPGTQLQTSGYYCVYNGTGNSVTVTNLAKNTQYSVQVFEYNGGVGNQMFNTSVGVNNPKSQTTANEGGTGFDAHDASKLLVYPNPVTDAFRIQGLSGVATITISDLSGRTLLQKQVSDNDAIFVTSLLKGIYVLKIKNNEGSAEHKIVKK